VSHLEHCWEEPGLARFFQRLGAFSRLIRLDKRGTVLSPRISEIPTLEQRSDDLRAVMDAAGSTRAALLGISEGGPVAMLFAATYPARSLALVLYGSYVRRTSAPEYPFGHTEADFKALQAIIEAEMGGRRASRRGSQCDPRCAVPAAVGEKSAPRGEPRRRPGGATDDLGHGCSPRAAATFSLRNA
jgi:pimeloyl-ACP methyl ester carboxylesterase